MNLKSDTSQTVASSIMPAGESIASETSIAPGWSSIAVATTHHGCQQEFAPECWRNFVTGTAFSLNNFDRAF
jgi:hypothetical protein